MNNTVKKKLITVGDVNSCLFAHVMTTLHSNFSINIRISSNDKVENIEIQLKTQNWMVLFPATGHTCENLSLSIVFCHTSHNAAAMILLDCCFLSSDNLQTTVLVGELGAFCTTSCCLSLVLNFPHGLSNRVLVPAWVKQA